MQCSALGLQILPHGCRRPITMALVVGLVFGAYMAIADGLAFRKVIPPEQAALVLVTQRRS